MFSPYASISSAPITPQSLPLTPTMQQASTVLNYTLHSKLVTVRVDATAGKGFGKSLGKKSNGMVKESTSTSTVVCPCGGGHLKLEYEKCCKPFHDGVASEPDATTPMKARFTAYANGGVDYIVKTTHPKNPYYSDFCCKQPTEAKDMIFTRLHADSDLSKSRIQSVEVADSHASVPFVKMCGITSVHDAVLAAEAGAQLIGMILWPKSKRSVSLHVAKEISNAVRDHGALPVGVFVDEDANEIERACDMTNIAFAQLHGNGARRALSSLVQHRNIIYVLHVDKSGVLMTKTPKEECSALVDWILIDSLSGGSGQKFDWENVQVPTDSSKNGWLLAGGINPENVSEAISILRPDALDVSSGICGPDGIQKDPARMVSFMHAVRQSK